MKMKQITPKFVDEIPDDIQDRILYISLKYNSVIHKCACGCGEIVSTPLERKHGWIIQYDGEKCSLYPSIGNGAYGCHSHYYIRENKILWLDDIDILKVEKGKAKDSTIKTKPFNNQMKKKKGGKRYGSTSWWKSWKGWKNTGK